MLLLWISGCYETLLAYLMVSINPNQNMPKHNETKSVFPSRLPSVNFLSNYYLTQHPNTFCFLLYSRMSCSCQEKLLFSIHYVVAQLSNSCRKLHKEIMLSNSGAQLAQVKWVRSNLSIFRKGLLHLSIFEHIQ